MVEQWVKEIKLLSHVALTEPQAAYSCFTSGYQHKFTYFIRTIQGIEEYLQPVEETIRHYLIPSITGGHICTDNERDLLSLPPRYGGLGLNIITQTAVFEHQNSKKMTQNLKKIILNERKDETDNVNVRNEIRKDRKKRNDNKLEKVRSEMNEKQKRMNTANQEAGSYNWLTALPLKEFGYDLNKEQFWDALRIRFNWVIPKLPSECACGSKFNVQHAISCKKGGFVTLRHNEVRDITTSLLNEVCKDVRKEPPLIQLTGETFEQRTANTSDEARLDVSALGFWTTGQRVFCDIRVFDHNAQRYGNTELKKCFSKNEEEKKKKYNARVLNVENGTFTPLVFSVNGGMGRECKKFYSRLTEMIAEKRNISNSIATTFIRTKISFSLLRSMLLCIRGSRSVKRINTELMDVDMELTNKMSIIQQM